MKQHSLKKGVVFVAFLLGLFVYDSARGQLPPGVVASFYYDEQGRVIRQEKDTNGTSESFSSVQEELNQMISEVPRIKRDEKIANKEGR